MLKAVLLGVSIFKDNQKKLKWAPRTISMATARATSSPKIRE